MIVSQVIVMVMVVTHLSVTVLTGLVNVNYYQCHHLTAHYTQLQKNDHGDANSYSHIFIVYS